jgi:hypothetical protein
MRLEARGKVLVVSVLLGLAIIVGASNPVGAYHESLYVTVNGVRMAPGQIRAIEEQIGMRLASGHYRYDPTTGRFWLAGTVQGGEQIYRGQGRQDYGWYNPRQGSSGYSNHNTGTNIICDGGSCNIAR